MRIRAIILISFIFLSILFLWLNGRIATAAGGNIDSEISQLLYRSSFLLLSVIISLIILILAAIGGLIYSKKKLGNRNYFIGFIYATIYLGIISGIFLYNVFYMFWQNG